MSFNFFCSSLSISSAKILSWDATFCDALSAFASAWAFKKRRIQELTKSTYNNK